MVRSGEVGFGKVRFGKVRMTEHLSENKKMKKYNVKVSGCSPIIWNVMKRELDLELKELKKNELAEWDEANWSRKAEFDEKGNAIVPDRWLKSAMVEACKKTRIIPHYATRKNETYTYYVHSFMVNNVGEPICKQEELESFGAFVGAQGANSNTKVWRTRPMMKNWSATFEIVDPAGRMKKDELKSIIEYAGMFVGIGDNRVNNFGRFELDELNEVDVK